MLRRLSCRGSTSMSEIEIGERGWEMRICRALLAAALCLPALAPGALAAPLEPQACTSLKTEYDGLVGAGAKADMAKGPDWAKANLAPERLKRIERVIALEEQLSFRCDLRLTAQPAIKEPPKPPQEKQAKDGAKQPGDDVLSALGLSQIPPPKRKDAVPAAARGGPQKKRPAGQPSP